MIDYPLLIKLLSISLVLILLFIGYRLILKRWNQKSIILEDYCELYTLDSLVNAGEISFYVTTQKNRSIRLSIQNSVKEILVTEKTIEPGGHIVRFDTRSVENGAYYYVLTTENQEVRKRIVIEN